MLITQIFQVTKGIVGDVVDLLNNAAIFAIENELECITEGVIKAVTGQRLTDEEIVKML